ncbi:acyltransferase family protein [Micromonospora sp. NPDC003197]
MSTDTPHVLTRLPALDAVRVIGAIAVLAQHVGFYTGVTLTASWGGWLGVLDVGVALFFVLSGFLLFRPWAYASATGAPAPSSRRYLWRRALRILPAYWLTVVVCLLLLPGSPALTTSDWLHYLTLTQIYDDSALRQSVGQTWSLATEVAFYLVLPLIAMAATGRRWRPWRAVAVAAATIPVTVGWLVAMATGLVDGWPYGMWLPSYATWFGAGIALAAVHVALATGTAPRAWRFLDALGRSPLACWAIALGVLAVATTPVAGRHDLSTPSTAQMATRLVLYLVVAVLVVLPIAFGPQTRTKAVLGTATARWLGTVSYGLFLWHPFVLQTVYRVTDRPMFSGDLLGTFALTLGGGLLLATISYYALERPALRLAAWRPRLFLARASRRKSATTTETQSPATAASAAN